MSNKLTKLAREILAVEEDLPYRMNYDNKVKQTLNDFDYYIFEQTWGSTALGFGGIGGQAMTTANTIVCIPYDTENEKCHVYFAGRYAYGVYYSEEFMSDVNKGWVEGKTTCGKYIKL